MGTLPVTPTIVVAIGPTVVISVVAVGLAIHTGIVSALPRRAVAGVLIEIVATIPFLLLAVLPPPIGAVRVVLPLAVVYPTLVGLMPTVDTAIEAVGIRIVPPVGVILPSVIIVAVASRQIGVIVEVSWVPVEPVRIVIGRESPNVIAVKTPPIARVIPQRVRPPERNRIPKGKTKPIRIGIDIDADDGVSGIRRRRPVILDIVAIFPGKLLSRFLQVLPSLRVVLQSSPVIA